jgi:hypothetical protein
VGGTLRTLVAGAKRAGGGVRVGLVHEHAPRVLPRQPAPLTQRARDAIEGVEHLLPSIATDGRVIQTLLYSIIRAFTVSLRIGRIGCQIEAWYVAYL